VVRTVDGFTNSKKSHFHGEFVVSRLEVRYDTKVARFTEHIL
jgi:hypothetical protein